MALVSIFVDFAVVAGEAAIGRQWRRRELPRMARDGATVASVASLLSPSSFPPSPPLFLSGSGSLLVVDVFFYLRHHTLWRHVLNRQRPSAQTRLRSRTTT